MKTVKRALALLLALTMLLAMGAVTVLAAGETGSITIDNAVAGQTYTIYEILYLESYNATAGAYSYKATSAWDTFVKSAAIKDVYLSIDGQGYVTWIKDADVAEFAALAQKYAADKKIVSEGSAKATSATVKFENLELGYYLVDSSLGTLCSLNTTNPDATIQEKNEAPTNEKKVEEDSTPGTYGSTNDADIGQTVNFQSTITAQAGAQNYIFHDTMSNGLTFGRVTGITLNGTTVDASNYTVKTDNLTDGCTFEVVFTQTFCDALNVNDKIVISYTAALNENAVVGTPGNDNQSKLEYGETGNTTTTPPSTTKTYTWGFDVLKYGNNDESKTLEGAKFVLLNKEKTKVATVVNGKLTDWVDVPAAGADDTIAWPENTVLTTDTNGKIEIAGLDADTYYLREVKAPAGYNVLDKDVEVEITPTVSADGKALTLAAVTTKVNNNSGAELPSTGGVGTTIFYVLGGLLVVCAGVLLITKRRMNKEA